MSFSLAIPPPQATTLTTPTSHPQEIPAHSQSEMSQSQLQDPWSLPGGVGASPHLVHSG